MQVETAENAVLTQKKGNEHKLPLDPAGPDKAVATLTKGVTRGPRVQGGDNLPNGRPSPVGARLRLGSGPRRGRNMGAGRGGVPPLETHLVENMVVDPTVPTALHVFCFSACFVGFMFSTMFSTMFAMFSTMFDPMFAPKPTPQPRNYSPCLPMKCSKGHIND